MKLIFPKLSSPHYLILICHIILLHYESSQSSGNKKYIYIYISLLKMESKDGQNQCSPMEFNAVSLGFDTKTRPFHINIHLHSNHISQRSPWRYAIEANMIIISVKQIPHGVKEDIRYLFPKRISLNFYALLLCERSRLN